MEPGQRPAQPGTTGLDLTTTPSDLPQGHTATRTVVTTENAPALPAPPSRGIRKDPVLQVSGRLPLAEQIAQTLRNVTAVLKAGGAGPEDVVMLRVHLTDPAHLAEMNEAYTATVRDEPRFRGSPTRSPSSGIPGSCVRARGWYWSSYRPSVPGPPPSAGAVSNA
ncbi:RidA family protein [Streptomyces sp. V3I8]|uniref:RidA family protein n=1 Tax=Streptomyces sp. V3I8 TaxID=3042279 RepID=UPI0027D9288C|nr:RidA family protein [Streptomyces sp. V3I8]